jgi:hypothetical protein
MRNKRIGIFSYNVNPFDSGLDLPPFQVSVTIDSGKKAGVFSIVKAAFLQLLSCLCYTQKHAQLDARAHEAP